MLRVWIQQVLHCVNNTEATVDLMWLMRKGIIHFNNTNRGNIYRNMRAFDSSRHPLFILFQIQIHHFVISTLNVPPPDLWYSINYVTFHCFSLFMQHHHGSFGHIFIPFRSNLVCNVPCAKYLCPVHTSSSHSGSF